jgi:uncharacterized phage protein (TIGR01671 family)
MREIRFRAWDIKEKKMWEVASLWGSGSKWELEPQRYGAKITSRLGDYEIRSCELMQYTGLKDKNGKEIYEGDIIKETTKDDKGEEIVSEVKFYDGIFGDDTMDGWTLKELVDEFGAYVIGNIYENPELLNSIN